MIYIHKVLPYFFYPITIILVLMIIAVIYKKRTPLVAAIFLLLVTSSPIFSDALWDALEEGQLRKLPSAVQAADAVVILSGMMGVVKSANGSVFEWSDPDRFFGGIELMRAGKAPSIIFTGGKLPWQGDVKTEGEILSDYAITYGIKPEQIQITTDVENTKDEAMAVKEILRKNNLNRIILVTSSFHMPRASRLFVQEGIEVQEYGVDSKVEVRSRTPMDFLPSAHAFRWTQEAVREFIGRGYYLVRENLAF